jgi:hypothetical protein
MVTKKILEIYDKYEGDFGLLDEPWAKKKDRELVSSEQAQILSNFIEKLEFLNLNNISSDLRGKTIVEIKKLELQIDQDVIDIIRKRMNIEKSR